MGLLFSSPKYPDYTPLFRSMQDGFAKQLEATAKRQDAMSEQVKMLMTRCMDAKTHSPDDKATIERLEVQLREQVDLQKQLEEAKRELQEEFPKHSIVATSVLEKVRFSCHISSLPC